MEIFGYNLTNNKFNYIKNTLLAGDNQYTNMFFGYSTRHNTGWGDGVLIYHDDISKQSNIVDPSLNLTDLETTDVEYYMSFFGDSSHKFRVVKSGSYKLHPEFFPPTMTWVGNWTLINKVSSAPLETENISFETLFSQQNSSNISKNKIHLYKRIGNSVNVTPITTGQGISIRSIYNIENSLYNAPLSCKLVNSGNYSDSGTTIDNLKFITNIVDGSYSKCYNLSLDIIDKINTNILNLSEYVFDLVNDNGITIITGVRFKSLIKISNIDYAILFEYATQTGSKNIAVTTENFGSSYENNEKLGIFMDSNYNLTNTNSAYTSPIDANLLTNSKFSESLTFGYLTNPSYSTSQLFIKYLLNTEFIEHNKIKMGDNIKFLADGRLSQLASYGWTLLSINGSDYYTAAATVINYDVAELFNVQNILIDIDLGTDFMGTMNNKYDMGKTDIGYVLNNGAGTNYIISNPDLFKLREIIIFIKDVSGKLSPIYYARTNLNINSNGQYKFQIII